MALTDKYRPKSFDDFSGSPVMVKILKKVVETQNVPGCMLFSGPRGTGKTSMARILASELNGGDSSDSMSYLEVDAASNSGVDNIRSLQEVVRFTHGERWRIVVLDEAHGLSAQAFNALLKVLEEPPPHTLFVLVTTRPEAIPDTVRSRAMTFRFDSQSEQEIGLRVAKIIISEKIPVTSADVVRRIAEVSEGSMRTAIVLLEQLSMLDEITVEAVNQLSGYTVDFSPLVYAMRSGSLQKFEEEITIILGQSYAFDKLINSFTTTMKEFHQNKMVTDSQFLNAITAMWSMRQLKTSNDAVMRSHFEAGMYYVFTKSFWREDITEAEESIEAEVATDEQVQNMFS